MNISKPNHTINPKFGRSIPHSKEIECSVLGALLLESQTISEVVEILNPECFHLNKNKAIYKAIFNLYKQNIDIDLNTVFLELKKQGSSKEEKISVYLAEITRNIASSAHLESHARILLEYSVRRKAIAIFDKSISKAYDESSDIFNVLDSSEQGLFGVTDQLLGGQCQDVTSVLAATLSKIEKIKTSEAGVVGISSGFHVLDQITHGWQSPDFVVVAARPGMGKTSFLLSILRHAAVVENKSVAIFSLEMSKEQIAQRLISQESGIPTEKIKTGDLDEKDWDLLYKKTVAINKSSIFIDDTPSLKLLELRAKCRRLKSQHKIDMIIVDYLQLMVGEERISGFSNREQEIASISRGLKAIAKELDIPVIVASQLSRAVETRGGDKRPQLSDLRESGAIEQDVDMAMFLYRAEYYGMAESGEGESTKGLCEVIIAKHRNGRRGKIKLHFNNELTKFSNYDSREENQGFVHPFEKI